MSDHRASEDTIMNEKAYPTASTEELLGCSSVLDGTQTPVRPSSSSSMWRRKKDKEVSLAEGKQRSAEIDRYLEDEARRSRSVFKILACGDSDESDALWKQISLLEAEKDGMISLSSMNMAPKPSLITELSNDQRLQLRQAARLRMTSQLRRHISHIISKSRKRFGASSTELERMAVVHILSRLNFGEIDQSRSFEMDESPPLWTSENIDSFKSQMGGFLTAQDQGLLAELDRIWSPTYEITERDWLMYEALLPGKVVREARFQFGNTRGEYTAHLLKAGPIYTTRRRLLHIFEGTKAVMFVADLALFDDVSMAARDSPTEGLMATFQDHWLPSFTNHIATRHFQDAAVVLVLSNVSLFRDKFTEPSSIGQDSPVVTHFNQGVKQQEAPEKVLNWVKDLFKAAYSDLREESGELHIHAIDTCDLESVRVLVDSFGQSVLRNAVKESTG